MLQPARRHFLILGVCSSLALGACGSSPSGKGSSPSAVAVNAGGNGSYLGTASNAVVLMQWTRSGNQLTGSLHQELVDTGGQNAQQTVNNRTVAFTGTVNGSGVTFSLNAGLGAVANLTGTLAGGRLDLGYPGQDGGVLTIHMHQASSADFNRAVADLRSHVGQNNQAQQQASQQRAQAQQVQGDAARVARDLNDLSSAAGQTAQSGGANYSGDLASARRDVATVQQGMQKVLDERGSADSGTVCVDAGAVQVSVGTVETDIGAIQVDQGTTQGSTSPVAAAVKQLRQDEAALHSDRANDPGDVPGAAPTSGQVQSAIRSALNAAGAATGSGVDAYAQAQALLQKAHDYQKRSDVACTAGG